VHDRVRNRGMGGLGGPLADEGIELFHGPKTDG